jgi:hypothetical protein
MFTPNLPQMHIDLMAFCLIPKVASGIQHRGFDTFQGRKFGWLRFASDPVFTAFRNQKNRWIGKSAFLLN